MKRILLTFFSALFIAVLLVYFGGVLFFSGRFFPNEYIDGIEVAYKTPMELTVEFSNRTSQRTILITMPDGESELATFGQLGITRPGDMLTHKFLRSSFLWPWSLFETKYYEIDSHLIYDDVTMTDAVSRLRCVREGVLAPTDAYIEKNADGDFVIVPDMVGTVVDVDLLKYAIVLSVVDESYDVDLLRNHCYAQATVQQDDEGLLNALDVANSFLETEIFLDFGSGTVEKIPVSVLKNVGNIVENRLVFDEDAVRAYVNSLADKYDTRGKDRVFVSSTGETLIMHDVPDEYRTTTHLPGWLMDRDSAYSAVMDALRSGRNMEVTIPWLVKGVAHGEDNDFGSTYLEVSISEQHLWFYENGELKAECDVVTGQSNDPKRATPTGLYRSTDLYTEHTMTGSYGSAFCHYFIRVTVTGVAVHDASWRSRFGGNIYTYDGSHGCINAPYKTVDVIFWAIKNNPMYTPIIVWD